MILEVAFRLFKFKLLFILKLQLFLDAGYLPVRVIC